MYYAKYIKYKNKYLNLKHQLAGAPTVVGRVRDSTVVGRVRDSTVVGRVRDSTVVGRVRNPSVNIKLSDSSNPQPAKSVYSLEQKLLKSNLKNINIPLVYKNLENIDKSLKENLVGIKILEADSVHLEPIVKYNQQFKSNPIYFYRYTGTDGKVYILCSLYSYFDFLDNLKESIKIEKININKEGYISSKIEEITIPKVSKDIKIETVKKSLEKNLVGVKILETNSSALDELIKLSKEPKFNYNPIHFYRYTDTDRKVYILCSMYSYYEFLDILYEHIEIEEINKDGTTKLEETKKIYHIIDKPKYMVQQSIPLHIESTEINTPTQLIDSLKSNPYIITNNEGILSSICMYNLFIGTIHVFVINVNDIPNGYFLLSLFTEYELKQYIGVIPDNIKLHECRLYKKDNDIKYKLNTEMVTMMFHIYEEKRKIPHFFNESRYYRGNQDIDYKFLNVLDQKLLDKCKECISVRDIAFNTTLWLMRDKIDHAINHKDILEMENDFVTNKHYLNNSNEKLMSWKQIYENLIQLWEYTLGDLRKEVEKFKKELLNLEPCHRELLVQKLNEKGFYGKTMNDILQNNALCYLKEKDNKKKLLYENPTQIDPVDNEFVKKCKFIPEIKELLKKKDSCENIESELHKYRQTVLLMMKNNENEKKYKANKRYFFAMSWFDPMYDKSVHEAFYPISWSIKLNKIAFQCLALRDNLIFPFRIINSEYLNYPLSYEFDLDKQEFCGFFHTNFIDNYNGMKKFDEECRDKFYFIYRYTDHTGNFSGKEYRIYYFTGNHIWFEVSMLPYYKVLLCEINWIYYTFILKYKSIPHFYKYINDYCEEEIVVSRFSLDEIRCIYKEKGYDESELDELKVVFYNHKFYNRKDIHDKIFVDNDKPLFSSKEEEQIFVKNVFLKNNIKI